MTWFRFTMDCRKDAASRARVVGVTALIALLAFASFAAGTWFQRNITVGYAIKWIRGVFQTPPDPTLYRPTGEFYSAVEMPAQASHRLPPQEALVRKRQASEVARLERQLPAERKFWEESETQGVLADLEGATRTRSPTEQQIQLGRYYRQTLVEDLRHPSSKEDQSRVVAAISGFAERLKRQGRHLLFVPLPNPVDVDLAHYLERAEVPSCSFADSELFIELLKNGVDVLDLREEFSTSNRLGRSPFHRMDHHWSPEALEMAAVRIHSILLAEGVGWERGALAARMKSHWVALPDVACNADYGPHDFQPGCIMARAVVLDDHPLRQSESAPLLVLGDSNVVHLADYAGHSCDFTSRLGFHLGLPLARFGQMGGTEHIPAVYEDMIQRTGMKPSVVIWVAFNGGWRGLRSVVPPDPVVSKSPQTSQLKGRYKVVAKSPVPEPMESPYQDALYAFKVHAVDPAHGTGEAVVVTWGFQGRKATLSRRVSVGQEMELDLKSWDEACKQTPGLRHLQRVDTLDEFELPLFFWPLDEKAGA